MDPHFPPEIWGNIFRFATFTATSLNATDWDPHWPYAGSPDAPDFDPALSNLSYQSTLPTKKSLTLVSRKFRQMSLEYLFELVQLFHTGNAQLLFGTILSYTTSTGTGDSPAKWIKSIIVSLDLDRSISDLYLMDEVLVKLFPFCTNLEAFGWKSYDEEPRAEGMDRSITSLMASIPPTISTLEWRRFSLVSLNSLQNHTALRNLSVSGILPISVDNCSVTIPFMTHLDVRTPHTIIAALGWHLPTVSHLTSDWAEGPLLRLIRKYGDLIHSVCLPEPWRFRSDGFTRILPSLPNLQAFSYGIRVNTQDQPPSSSPWLGVGGHASLTHVYLFCRGSLQPGKRSFSKIQAFFSFHLQPLTSGHFTSLTINIVDARHFFEQGDFKEDGYDAAAKQRFFDDLSACLSSEKVQCIVK